MKDYTVIVKWCSAITILIAMVFIEPIVFHPMTVYASLKGYWHFLIKKEQKWGVQSRQGFDNSEKKLIQ